MSERTKAILAGGGMLAGAIVFWILSGLLLVWMGWH